MSCKADKNPETAQIQGPMMRSKTKQLVDTFQQMVADILNKAQVEKDEGPEAEALLSILIVAEAQD